MPVITEVKDAETLPLVAEYADVLQVGARNMQNFSLLERIGELGKPVMLKRGLSSTVKEWLMAAEYIVSRGNRNVILCERGIRTFETLTRNTLDLGVLPLLRAITHLPIIVDPSHGTGVAKAVIPLARAAAATGVDGVMGRSPSRPGQGPLRWTPGTHIRHVRGDDARRAAHRRSHGATARLSSPCADDLPVCVGSTSFSAPKRAPTSSTPSGSSRS